MTYSETLDYLYASRPAFHLVGAAAYKPGLQNTCALMEHLGHPEYFPAVHVAGTNGKGSTSHLIAASLQCAGLKVGLYTSPHLVDFRERIRVNGVMIPCEDVVRFVEDNRAFLDTLQPSFFETAMALAFWFFAREKVDIAVVEVGLGGRLDSTNILPPYRCGRNGGVLLSVITNIGLDHTDLLGDTLAKIAAEKAGIIKPNVPCVIGETHADTAPVFMSRAEECGILGDGLETTGCRLWFADRCTYLNRRREASVTECQLHGLYQQKNMQTAYVALRALMGMKNNLHPAMAAGLEGLDTEAIRRGFASVCTLTGLRGRWEVLGERPLTVCDTGHNSHGIRYVADQLRRLIQSRQADGARLFMVFGMVADKDVEIVMNLLPEQAVYYFTQARTQRAISAEKMQTLWRQGGHTAPSYVFSSVEAALNEAKNNAAEKDIIFIGGSNYVVGEALQLM